MPRFELTISPKLAVLAHCPNVSDTWDKRVKEFGTNTTFLQRKATHTGSY